MQTIVDSRFYLPHFSTNTHLHHLLSVIPFLYCNHFTRKLMFHTALDKTNNYLVCLIHKPFKAEGGNQDLLPLERLLGIICPVRWMVIGYLEMFGTSAWLNTLKSNNFNQFIALFCCHSRKVIFYFFLALSHNLSSCQIWLQAIPNHHLLKCCCMWLYGPKASWKRFFFFIWAKQSSNSPKSALVSPLPNLCNGQCFLS